MRPFSDIARRGIGVLIRQARDPFCFDGANAPTTKCRYVLSPEDAPKTIVRNRDYPNDFHLYVFAGPMVEQVRLLREDGDITRCPALVARMVRRTEFTQGSMMGASSTEEMTCSLKDLRTYKNDAKKIIGHPLAERITHEMNAFYVSKVASRQREESIKETDFIHTPSGAF